MNLIYEKFYTLNSQNWNNMNSVNCRNMFAVPAERNIRNRCVNGITDISEFCFCTTQK